MSFILDALKKSDSERQRQTGPALFEIRRAAPRAGRLPGWALVLGALLLVNLVALGWFLARARAPVAAAAPAMARPASPEPPAAPPAVPPTIAPAAAAQAAAPVLPPRPQAAPEAVAADTGDEPGNPAAHEAALPAGSAREPVAQGDAATPAPEDVRVDRSIAPTVEQLPASFASQLPTLHLDLHVYATRAADRFVLVNMQRLREGDATRDGVRVEAITPTGVVLSFRGTRFQLERE